MFFRLPAFWKMKIGTGKMFFIFPAMGLSTIWSDIFEIPLIRSLQIELLGNF
jgi:hypothetical protein